MPFRADIYETPDAPGKVFYIDNKILSYHDIEMNIEEVRGFRYGTVMQFWEGYNFREGFSTFDFIDTSNDVINVLMLNTMKVQDENLATMSNMAFAVQKYVGNKLVLDMISAIHHGAEVSIGNVMVDRYGVHFTNNNSWGRESRWDIPWEQIRHWSLNGQLNIASYSHGDANLWLDARLEYHVHTLHAILYSIQQDPATLGRLRGMQTPLLYYRPMD